MQTKIPSIAIITIIWLTSIYAASTESGSG